jgi:hypothetical protein
MDEEMRMRKLELTVHNHNRRLDDHDKLHVDSRKDIAMLQEIAKSNQDILEAVHDLKDYAKKTYDVFEPMARYGSRLIKIFAVFIAVWHAVKWAYAKLVLFT